MTFYANYKKIQDHLKDKRNFINKFKRLLKEQFNLPDNINDDAVEKELILILERSCVFTPNALKYFHSIKTIIKSFLVYYLTMLYLLYSSLGLFRFFLKKHKKTDILYEELWDEGSWYSRFYKYIDEFLPKQCTRTLLMTCNVNPFACNKYKVKDYLGPIIDIRWKNYIFDHQISWLAFKRSFLLFGQLYRLSKSSSLNMIYLYLRLLRKIVIYHSHIKDIEAKVLVMAGDYYYNPLKYYIYKKKIDNICLLQHNHCNNSVIIVLAYADLYFMHSKNSVRLAKQFSISKLFFSIGSLQLNPFLNTTKERNYILFLHQPVDVSTLSAIDINSNQALQDYLLLLKNLKLFAKKHSRYKILYAYKGNNDQCDPRDEVLIKKAKYILKDCQNISFNGVYGSTTFQQVAKADLLINIYSSVGVESYGLDTKNLWINYDNLYKNIGFPNHPEDLDVLIKNNYKAFEEKIFFILDKNNKEFEKFYKAKKANYMDIKKDPAKVVAQKIYQLT